MWLYLNVDFLKTFPISLFSPLPFGSSSLRTSLVFCSSYFPSDYSPFAHLKWSPLVSAWNWQFKFKRKPSQGNLFWHIRIVTQSFAGLMGWLKTSLCLSHVHLCVWRWRCVYSFGGFCLFFYRIRLNLETSVILLNVPLSEVYWRTKMMPKKSECFYHISFMWTCMRFRVLTFLKGRKLL